MLTCLVITQYIANELSWAGIEWNQPDQNGSIRKSKGYSLILYY
jgi:hypothetical protein